MLVLCVFVLCKILELREQKMTNFGYYICSILGGFFCLICSPAQCVYVYSGRLLGLVVSFKLNFRVMTHKNGHDRAKQRCVSGCMEGGGRWKGGRWKGGRLKGGRLKGQDT